MNPELGGVTLGWNLTHTAQDELFAAIEGTAFHTRVILERMAEHGVPIRRVINGGGIPQKNETLNRVYANVLNKPVLVPEDDVTSLGSAIIRVPGGGRVQEHRGSAAGALPALSHHPAGCAAKRRYEQLYDSIASCTSPSASPTRTAIAIGDVLPALRKLSAQVRHAAG